MFGRVEKFSGPLKKSCEMAKRVERMKLENPREARTNSTRGSGEAS